MKWLIAIALVAAFVIYRMKETQKKPYREADTPNLPAEPVVDSEPEPTPAPKPDIEDSEEVQRRELIAQIGAKSRELSELEAYRKIFEKYSLLLQFAIGAAMDSDNEAFVQNLTLFIENFTQGNPISAANFFVKPAEANLAKYENAPLGLLKRDDAQLNVKLRFVELVDCRGLMTHAGATLVEIANCTDAARLRKLCARLRQELEDSKCCVRFYEDFAKDAPERSDFALLDPGDTVYPGFYMQGGSNGYIMLTRGTRIR